MKIECWALKKGGKFVSWNTNTPPYFYDSRKWAKTDVTEDGEEPVKVTVTVEEGWQ